MHDADAPHRQRPSPAPGPSDPHFCTECLTTLKQATTWCTVACAAANFQTHREEVHLPGRTRLGLANVDYDEAQLEYVRGGDTADGNRKYRARDIGALTTSLEEAVREWEGRNRVRLHVG